MRRAPALAVALLLVACGEHKFEPPERDEQVAAADSLYSPAAFDTIAWADEAERMQAGNTVYATECRECHGTMGAGDTDYDRAHSLHPPSLVRPAWGFGDSIAAVRRRVFAGHAGMPTWGVAGITPREIDAVAYYLVRGLRPEVLDTAAGGPAGDR